MTIIGITGGSGVGKTTALQVLHEMGATCIDCDAVYHKMLNNGGLMLDEIGTRFPDVVAEGKLDRAKLGQIVFRDARALADLNAITHGYVREELEWLLADIVRTGGNLVAVDAVALIESGLARRCTAVVGIIAPVELRAARIVARDSIATDDAMLRIRSQKPDSFYREHCDYILENNTDVTADFAEACRALFRGII